MRPSLPRPTRITAPAAVLELLARGAAVDDQEDLDLLQHSLQCAALLRGEAPDDLELQVAGLVHDLGSVLAPRQPATHAATGAAAVVGLLGRDVAWLVASHAEAKRHLVTVDPAYAEGLSARSIATLRAQGGRVPPAVVAARAHAPAWNRALTLRRADDRAKVVGWVVPGLDSWVAPLEAVAVRLAGTEPYNLDVRRAPPGDRPARPIRSRGAR